MSEKPSVIGAILRKPSFRTQTEAMLVGILVLILASLVSSIYLIFFTSTHLFLKILTGVGEVGILLMMLSNLAMTYIQLYTYKLTMGIYDFDTDGVVSKEEGEKVLEETNLRKELREKEFNAFEESERREK